MPSRMFALMFIVCIGITSGCMTASKDDEDSIFSTHAPNSSAGAATKEDEEWSKVGRQMRGDPPAPQAFDPLRDVMASPKAQSIERSLGVDG